jgi:hypothetical protein
MHDTVLYLNISIVICVVNCMSVQHTECIYYVITFYGHELNATILMICLN